MVREMPRFVRIVAWIAGIFVGLVVLLVIALFVMPWDWVRAPLDKRLSDASQRSVAIDGPLDIHVGLTTRVVADDIRVANAPWGSAPQMVQIKQLRISVYLPDLLRGRTVIPELALVEPKIVLEKNKQGEANWRLANPKAKAVGATVPQNRTQIPILEHLSIENGRLAYKDANSGIDMDSHVNTALGGDPSHERLRLRGNGNFHGDPFTLSMEGGSILQLRDETQPYPIHIEATIGKTKASVDGTVTEPLQLAGIDLKMHLAGDDLANIYPIFGIPIPNTPPYSLAGTLVRQGQTWTFKDFAGKVGNSDMSGTLSVTTGGQRPQGRAVLISKNLDLKDLGGFIGAKPGQPSTQNPNKVLPDRPINLERLRSADMEVHFNGRRVSGWNLPIDNLDAALKIDNGRATLDPVSFGVAHGKIAGTVVLDGRQQVPAAQINLQVEQVDLSQFFHDPKLRNDIRGTLGGHFDIGGGGRSTAEILGHSDGRIGLFMGGGQFSSLLVDLMGLEIGKALGILATKDKPQAIRCMVADFGVKQGVMTPDTLVFDTASSDITGKGTVGLGDESLALQLTAHPKQASLLAATAPIDIGGTFKHPTFGVDAKAEAARTGAAAVLGALLTPLGALLPFIDLGLGKDSPCHELIQRAQAGAQQAGTPPGNAAQ
jgi:AsmA family protein